MSEQKPFPITWEQMHRDTKILASKIQEKGNFKQLLTVVRGGLVPSAIISKELEITLVDTICLSKENQDVNPTIEVVTKGIDSDGEGILIIDDLVNTGQTARLIKELYPKAFFAALYTKPSGQNLLDAYVTMVEQDSWIVFPWEKNYNYL